MNPAQFIALNELQQMELIWERAIYLGERDSGIFKHILYNLDGLYVEETRYASYHIWQGYRCVINDDISKQYIVGTT